MGEDYFAVSTDGTQVAYAQSGSGAPLVLVHGTSSDHSSFRFIEPLLTERFTIHAVDRRGRGQSGDSKDGYTIEQEFADVAAVVDSLSQPADLFGHSFGATVALGAASLAQNLRRLILYEPAPGISAVTTDFQAKLDALLAEDRRHELLSAVMVEFAGFGPAELEQLRASPVWALRVAAAHTIPREIRAEENYQPDPDAFAAVSIPVMLLLGSESPEWARHGTDVAQSLLRKSHVVMLEGQGHVATLTAPEMVADEVVRFLSAGVDKAER
jgi:pimeloyl-ACP methyl ester carboxylesterase